MRFASIALAGGFLLAATAAYADDPMSMTYGNTVTSKDKASGASATLLFDAGGTYTTKATGADGKPVQFPGKWVVQDGGKTLCLTPDSPPGAAKPPATSCSPLETHKVGDTWTVTNDQKQSFDVTLSAGR